jgi:transposase
MAGIREAAMSGIEITRRDLGSAELRREAGRATSAKAARRLIALALVVDGKSREEAARTAGMDRQTLRDWVHRYNAEGVAGLVDRKQAGRTPRLDAEKKAKVLGWVEAGPDMATDKVVRWRRKDLSRKIKESFGIELKERAVGSLLKAAGYRRLSVRPRHPAADAQAEEAFKKTSRGR